MIQRLTVGEVKFVGGAFPYRARSFTFNTETHEQGHTPWKAFKHSQTAYEHVIGRKDKYMRKLIGFPPVTTKEER